MCVPDMYMHADNLLESKHIYILIIMVCNNGRILADDIGWADFSWNNGRSHLAFVSGRVRVIPRGCAPEWVALAVDAFHTVPYPL